MIGEVLERAMYGTPELGWEVERIRTQDARHGRLFVVNVKRWIGGIVASTEEECATHDLQESFAHYINIRDRLGE